MMTYGHGGDIYSYSGDRVLLDFSSNINPLGLPPAVEKALQVSAGACTVYPDPHCRAVSEKIGEYENVPFGSILCGNGAADLIYRIAYGLKPKKALLFAPTFSEYEQAVRQSGGAVYYYGLRDENEFVPQRDFLRMLDSTQPDIVFLCNPNNPTGKTVAKELMTETAVWCQSNNAVLVIDECFLDFVRNGKALSMIGETEKNPNIIILKAFTKFFAMPGLRFGYLVCGSEELRKKIWKAGQPWSVSGVAQLCGAAALSDKTYIEQTKKLIPRFRENLQTELEKLPLRVYSGAANYILFRTTVPQLDQKTAARDILIRNCANYHGLCEGYYRVAVKSSEDNRKLIQTMQAIFTESCAGSIDAIQFE